MSLTATYKNIWSIAYPIMIGALAQNLIFLIDTAFLARVGEVELGASAIGGIFYLVLVMLGQGLGIGTQILIARRVGENNLPQVGKIFDHSLYLTLGIGALLFILLLQTGPLLTMWVESPQVLAKSIEFLDFRAYGILFGLLNWITRGFFTGIARTWILIGSTMFMALVNIALDYALIFGHWGLPEMGIGGAALASVIAEACACAALFGFIYWKRFHHTYHMMRFPKPSRVLFGRVLTISAPLILQFLLSISSWFIFFLAVEHLGEEQLAVSNVLRSMYGIIMIPTWGFAAAANSVVSNILGQSKPEEVPRAIKKVMLLSFSVSLFLAIIVALFPDLIFALYDASPTMIKVGMTPMYVVAFSLLVFSITGVLLFSVTGTGASNIALAIEIIAVIGYLIYLWVIVFVKEGGLAWVWGAEPLYWALLLIFCGAYLLSGRWKKIQI